jgi:hypothetical protein
MNKEYRETWLTADWWGNMASPEHSPAGELLENRKTLRLGSEAPPECQTVSEKFPV